MSYGFVGKRSQVFSSVLVSEESQYIGAVHIICYNTHRRVKEDMSSKTPVGRVAMALFEITLIITGFTTKEQRHASERDLQILELHLTRYE